VGNIKKIRLGHDGAGAGRARQGLCPMRCDTLHQGAARDLRKHPHARAKHLQTHPVCHPGLGAGWHVEKVVVENLTSGRVYIFDINRCAARTRAYTRSSKAAALLAWSGRELRRSGSRKRSDTRAGQCNGSLGLPRQGLHAQSHLSHTPAHPATAGATSAVPLALLPPPSCPPVRSWFDKGEDDGAIERDLLPTSGSGEGFINWKLTVVTGKREEEGVVAAHAPCPSPLLASHSPQPLHVPLSEGHPTPAPSSPSQPT
jgi:hypothetical protein